MENIEKKLMTVEHHCLDTQYMHLRVHNYGEREKLASSIGKNGQLMPIIMIPSETQHWTLIDGHLRVQALKCLGSDTVTAELWQCDATEALLSIIKNHSGRPLDTFEEALLIKELHIKHGLTQDALSRRIGRDPSWVSRRLSLIEFLPDSILQALSNGEISLWVATRVLTPLARANSGHAEMLLNYLRKHFNSTRELEKFYKHYQSSNSQERANMAKDPGLFFKAQKILYAEKDANLLKEGPEGQWKYKLGIITNLLSDLTKLSTAVFFPHQTEANIQDLIEKFNNVWQQITKLNIKLEKFINAR